MTRPVSGLITGTSSEYLGSRPLRRILRERSVVIVLGPPRSGKSTVAARIASWPGQVTAHRVDARRLTEEVVRFARLGRWTDAMLRSPALVLDGPQNLPNRPGVQRAVIGLIAERTRLGLRSVICDVRGDGSAELIMDAMPAGSMAVVGLRLPGSRSGRLRFARRCCDDLGISREYAHGTDQIEPWGYSEVLAVLRGLVPREPEAAVVR